MPITKKDINDVSLEPPKEKTLLPVIPTWSFRVNGRKFGHYMAIARRKPRRSVFFLPMADPCSSFANIWGSIATFNDFSYTAFVVPLSLAFNDLSTVNAYWYLDFIGSVVYILDLLIEFHVGFIVRWDSSSVTITDGIQVAKNYMRNGTFWIDFIACLPFFGQIAITASTGERSSSAAVRSILLLKLLRLGRVVRLIARMNKFDTGGIFQQWIAARVNALTMFAFNTFFSLMVTINLLACMWWWIAITQGLENSWVAAAAINKPEIDLIDGNDATRWLVSAYFSLVTMATIGYGDIVAVTTAEIGLVILFIFCGVAFFGFVLSTVSALLESRSSEDSMSGGDWTKFQEMESWMQRFSFPKSLQREIRRHCYAASMSTITASHDTDFYKVLPLWLKVKVAVELQKTGIIALVGGQSVWDTLPSDTQTAVAKITALISEPELMISSSKLYSCGDECENIYFLEEGQLGLYVPGVAKIVTISSPAVLGTGSLFRNWSEACSTCKSTAVTATRCFLWKINASMLEQELIDIAPEVLQLILIHYVEELKRTRAQLENNGKSPQQIPSMVLLRQAYDVRIEGATLAVDNLKATMETLKQQQQQQNEVERQESALHRNKTSSSKEKGDREKLEWQKVAGLVEEEVARNERSPAKAAATRLLEMELHSSIAAGDVGCEIDLERNGDISMSEDLENRLDQTQVNMYLEVESSKEVSMSTAAGVLRKEDNNVTFVV
ncbi:hypothetical protein Ndes2526B_g07503 [Nannochloris sp. 'desiccata']|nr:hypothetical protein KSW81_001239 [Chlorella desiccata (nom. nud.)]KAH7617638.1 putative Potassium channel GORK [Chlorella desiccata (nom. nud.)]